MSLKNVTFQDIPLYMDWPSKGEVGRQPLLEQPVCQLTLDFLEPESQILVRLPQLLRFPS